MSGNAKSAPDHPGGGQARFAIPLDPCGTTVRSEAYRCRPIFAASASSFASRSSTAVLMPGSAAATAVFRSVPKVDRSGFTLAACALASVTASSSGAGTGVSPARSFHAARILVSRVASAVVIVFSFVRFRLAVFRLAVFRGRAAASPSVELPLPRRRAPRPGDGDAVPRRHAYQPGGDPGQRRGVDGDRGDGGAVRLHVDRGVPVEPVGRGRPGGDQAAQDEPGGQGRHKTRPPCPGPPPWS